MLGLRAARVFAEADVADPVQAIFNAPVTAIQGEQISGRGSLCREAGDGVGDLRRYTALRFDGAFDAANLGKAWPVVDFRQARTGLQMPLGEAAMALVLRAMFRQLCLTCAFTRGGKIPAGIRLQSPLSARIGCLSQRSGNRPRCR